MTEIIEVKGIPGFNPEDKVTIHRMNYGYRQDLMDSVTKYIQDATGKRQMQIMSNDLSVNTLVYGIVDGTVLGLGVLTKDELELGLGQEKFVSRRRVIRAFEDQKVPEHILKAINDINEEKPKNDTLTVDQIKKE
jgi:hypothetical protein